jgi:hypothetical protein
MELRSVKTVLKKTTVHKTTKYEVRTMNYKLCVLTFPSPKGQGRRQHTVKGQGRRQLTVKVKKSQASNVIRLEIERVKGKEVKGLDSHLSAADQLRKASYIQSWFRVRRGKL